MENKYKALTKEMQTSMAEAARSCFSESEQDHLRCLVRLTIEFHNYLQNGAPQLRDIAKYRLVGDFHIQLNAIDLNELKYSSESIFSGIDSFCSVNAAYRVLVGATNSKVECDMVSMDSLINKFIYMFREFIVETNFENKCRLLLDLFKIQIVFAGVFYD